MSTEVDEAEDIDLSAWDLPSSIQDEDDVEKIMEAFMDEELAIQKEDTKIANCIKRKKRHQARLEWLHKQHDLNLEAYALNELKGCKAKFIQFTHGRIAYRAAPGGTRLANVDKAVAWLKDMGYEHKVIVTESTSTEYVLDALNSARQSQEIPLEAIAVLEHCLETTPPGENVTIGAGILKATGRRSQLVVPTPTVKEPTPIGDLVGEIMDDINSGGNRVPPEDDDDIPW